jgi:hypothetical protein
VNAIQLNERCRELAATGIPYATAAVAADRFARSLRMTFEELPTEMKTELYRKASRAERRRKVRQFFFGQLFD